MRLLLVALVLLLTASMSYAGGPADGNTGANPADAAADPSPEPPKTPVALFFAVEGAWLKADGERFASLVDTTAFRIALKPGEAPTAAVTRTAAAFLFQDQVRLTATKAFSIVRFHPTKKGVMATAAWSADWGGNRGQRDVEVTLTAVLRGGRWLLSEVRAKD